MDEPQQIQIGLEPQAFFLSGVQVAFSEEEFLFMMTSGNSGRRYIASPKHAKRILLLLQQKIDEYEKSYGPLKTELPRAKDESSKNQFGFSAR